MRCRAYPAPHVVCFGDMDEMLRVPVDGDGDEQIGARDPVVLCPAGAVIDGRLF